MRISVLSILPYTALIGFNNLILSITLISPMSPACQTSSTLFIYEIIFLSIYPCVSESSNMFLSINENKLIGNILLSQRHYFNCSKD